MEHLAVLPIRYPETRQSQFSLEHQDVVYLRPVIRGILPPSGVEILLASARCILHQHLVLPRFKGVRSPINMSPDLTGLGDVSGALEGRRLEYDKPIRVPAALPDSCEFRGQRIDKAAPNSPSWRVIPHRGHDRQGSPEGLPRLVIFDPPTEVRSIQLFLA